MSRSPNYLFLLQLMVEYHFFTDSIIAASGHFALGTLITSIYAMRKQHTPKRWPQVLIILSILYFVFLAYTLLIVPRSIKTTSVSVNFDEFEGDPFTIAVISDLHAGAFGNAVQIETAVNILDKRKDIDALFLAGDILDNEGSKLDSLAPLAALTDSIPTYAVFGNHDYTWNTDDSGDYVIIPGLVDYLKNLGITVLLNDCVSLAGKDDDITSVTIIGTVDIDVADPDFSCIYELAQTENIILLAHNPDTAAMLIEESDTRKVDLVVSGHTHGGELRLPGNSYLLPLPTHILPDSFDKGLFTYENVPLFISSGVGNTISRIRTWNNPEVVLITISESPEK